MGGGNFLVEFVGGPFDGDTCVVLRPPTPGRVGLPVSPIDDNDSRSVAAPLQHQPTSIAIYELQAAHTRWIYRYIEALAPGSPEEKCDCSPPAAARRTDAFDGSLFVARDATCGWYVTIDDRGRWWVWNDANRADRAEFASLERAVAYIRIVMRQASAAAATSPPEQDVR